jgi:energy-converting hydrogenase Eha subunit E
MIILIAISALMLAVSLTACIKPGTKDEIVKYDNIESEEER